MRVLLTGAAGFIGSHVAEALLARGDEVIGLDSFDPFYAEAIKRRHVELLLRWPGFVLAEADIRDARALRQVLATGALDAVVHLAARAGVRPSLLDPTGYFDVNVTGTVRLVEAARAVGIRRFVVASSSSVYGADTPAPFRTDAPAAHPCSPYAASKRAAELACTALADLHGLAIDSLRYFTVFGPRQRPDMGLHRFIEAVRAGEPIRRHGDGASRRDYTFVSDAAAATVAALDHTDRVAGGHRVYNVGGGTAVTLDAVIASVERHVGKPAVVEVHPDQPGDVPFTDADVVPTTRDLGWSPRVGFDAGLALQVAWHAAAAVPARPPARRVDAAPGAARSRPIRTR